VTVFGGFRDSRLVVVAPTVLAAVVLLVLQSTVAPALLGLSGAERAQAQALLVWVGAPGLSVLALLLLRAVEPLEAFRARRADPELRSAARAACVRLPDQIARAGLVCGMGATLALAATLWSAHAPPRLVVAAVLLSACAVGAVVPPLVLALRMGLSPLLRALADETLPPGAALPLRTQLWVLLSTLGALGVLPPAVIGAARLDQVAESARRAQDQAAVQELVAAAPSLDDASLRARVLALPRALLVDERGELSAGVHHGRVEALYPLGPPHAGLAVGFSEERPPLGPRTALFGALLLFVWAALAVGRRVAGRFTSDVERVQAKIAELARGELGEPLAQATIHTAEVRGVVDATNALLARMSEIQMGRFVAIEQAVEGDRVRTQFFAHVSHDLRGPLTSIVGFCDLLLKEMEGPLEPAQRDAMVIIRTLAEHVSELVGEILDWARVSAGRLELASTWTPAAELLRDAATLASARLPPRVALTADPAAGLPQMLLDRRRAAEAIATFLVVTARRVQAGRLNLTARGAEVSGVGPALVVTIESAMAIPAAEAARALEPFQPWPGDGLGLALPLARRVVELHGGRVEVAAPEGSEGGERSRFVLAWPVGQTVYRRAHAPGLRP
jgi:signal transduction histidine kinase